MESILDPVLLVIARIDLRPEVRDAVIASQLKRDKMVNLIASRYMRRDAVLGVDTLLD
jgi:hypothetical protein